MGKMLAWKRSRPAYSRRPGSRRRRPGRHGAAPAGAGDDDALRVGGGGDERHQHEAEEEAQQVSEGSHPFSPQTISADVDMPAAVLLRSRPAPVERPAAV